MKELVKTYNIHAHPADVWQALTDCKVIEKWSGAPCQMSPDENFAFSLWGGDIHGKNIEIIPQKKLVQQWFSGQWERPSLATFTLKESAHGTELKLVQTDIPDEALAEIDSGWDDYYLEPLKRLLENQI